MGLNGFAIQTRSSAFSRIDSRNGGIDLLKMFCAILIVFFHVLPDLGVPGALGPDRLYAILFGSWGVYAVDVFFVASAYFLSKGHFHFQSFIHVFVVTLAFIFAFGILTIRHQITVVHVHADIAIKEYFLSSIFDSPLWLTNYWYVTSYLFAYLFFPFIKKGLAKLTPTQDKVFLGCLAALFLLANFKTTYSALEDIPFVLALYSLVYILEKRQWTHFFSRFGWLIILILFIQTVVSRFYYDVLEDKRRWLIPLLGNISRHSFTMALMALSSFYIAKDLPIKGNNFFKYCGGATLEVYLFHEGPFSMKNLLKTRVIKGWLGISDITAEAGYRWISFLYCFCFFLIGWILGLIIEVLLRLFEEGQSKNMADFLLRADSAFND
jgi:hypothetical protein